jgi:hypothetical protein
MACRESEAGGDDEQDRVEKLTVCVIPAFARSGSIPDETTGVSLRSLGHMLGSETRRS